MLASPVLLRNTQRHVPSIGLAMKPRHCIGGIPDTLPWWRSMQPRPIAATKRTEEGAQKKSESSSSMIACESSPRLRGPDTRFRTTGVVLGEPSIISSFFTRRAARYSAAVLPLAGSSGKIGALRRRLDDRDLKTTNRMAPVRHPMRPAVPRKTYNVCNDLVTRSVLRLTND